MAVGTDCGYLKRAKAAGVTWERLQHMTDSEVEALLFNDTGRNQAARHAALDYAHVHCQLQKSTATLEGDRRPTKSGRGVYFAGTEI